MKINSAQVRTLLHNLSHDLRGSLGVSSGLLALLSEKYDDQLDPKAHKWLELISNEYKVSQAKLNGLFAYNNLMCYRIDYQTCNLAAIAQQAKLQVNALVAQGEDECLASVSLCCEMGQYESMVSDKHLLYEFLHELLLNASRHATPEQYNHETKDPINCRVSVESGHDSFTITFEDNGTTLLASDLAYIQEPFRTLKAKSRSNEITAGMGFTKLHLIAELLDATLHCQIGTAPFSGIKVSLQVKI